VRAELKLNDAVIFNFGVVNTGANPQRLVRYIDSFDDSKDGLAGELTISFPISSRPCMPSVVACCSAGGLLLVFGAVLKGLMERLLALPGADGTDRTRDLDW